MRIHINLYRALVLAMFLGVNALILLGIGGIWTYLNTGADRSLLLQDVRQAQEYHQEVVWLEPDAGQPDFQAYHKTRIQEDYLTSWAYRIRAWSTRDPKWLRDVFTDSAYVKMAGLLDTGGPSGFRVDQINISHALRPVFMSADQTLAVIRDERATWFKQVFQDEQVLFEQTGSSAMEYVMLLEDGFWRIRNFREIHREESGPDRLPASADKTVDVSGLSGVNYYPAANPWDHFGGQYNDSTTREDLLRIKALGMHTVRVFLPYAASGGARPSDRYLGNLKAFLNRAEQAEVGVILTLFDFYGDYSLPDWPATRAHALRVAEATAGHPALVAWDIKNEPDLDYGSRGEARVQAWLAFIGTILRESHPDVPLTIGWSDPEPAASLEAVVDMVSFHFYRDPEDFATACAALQEAVTKPVVLQEFGQSSYGGIWNFFSGSQGRQADYLVQMTDHARELGIPYLYWTLYDYQSVPTAVVGRAPWRRAAQRHFGLLTTNGAKKEAARLLFPE